MTLKDTIKHAVFTDEGDTPTPPPVKQVEQARPTPPPAPAINRVLASSPGAAVPDDNEVYLTLRAGTEFADTGVYHTITKCLDPLDAIPDSAMSPQLKFKTAMIQAKAQYGLTKETVLGMFDTLTAELGKAQQEFNQQARDFTLKIADKEKCLADKHAQLDRLQQEATQLSGEIDADKKHVQDNMDGFTAAFQRRQQELDTERAKYAALLKG